MMSAFSWSSPRWHDCGARGAGARVCTAGTREAERGTSPRAGRFVDRRRGRDAGPAGAQRLGEDDDPEAHQPAARAHRRRGRGGGGGSGRRSGDATAPANRLRDPGDRTVPSLHCGAERRARAAARGLAAGPDRRAGARAAGAGGPRPRRLRGALPPRAVGRAAPARGRRSRPRRRPAAAAPRRAVRRARSHHAGRAAARVSGARGTARQGDGVRDPRRARGTAARHAAGVPGERPPGGAEFPGGGVPDPVQFYARNSQEVWGLVGQHLSLVAISTGIAIVIGIPLGVVLTRRPAWRGPVLGLANVFQTIPSLALFGFLIPLPLIGGIGATTAIVALVVYGLLPIVRNTYTGIAGVDPAVREAGRGMGMTDWQLLTLVELPLGFGVMLAGVRVATVVSVGTATIAAAIGAGGLGVYIFRGVAMVNDTLILAGAVPAALMALAADGLLGLAERRFAWRAK